MDKTEALSRLDALDHEAAELRKIIEKAEKNPRLTYNDYCLYVAMCGDNPSILAGYDSFDQRGSIVNYFRWHEFQGYATAQGWAAPHRTGQEALDSVQDEYEVRAFRNAREGMDYFYKLYCEAHPK